VVWRRLKHPEWHLPQIILVDGGKPQVSAASMILNQYKEKISLIGLAKREETIVIKTADHWTEINLPKNSPSLLLLQHLRDEAHRFANKYRKELIKRSLK
jgi:excinuclease ABC subunit C